MADRLDGKRLEDGRYFQVTPGKHELVVRFDFEVYSGGFSTDPPSEPATSPCATTTSRPASVIAWRHGRR
jgi:hypothetical protein